MGSVRKRGDGGSCAGLRQVLPLAAALACLLLLPAAGFAREQGAQEQVEQQEEMQPEDAVYRIRSVRVEVKGRTRGAVIRHVIDIEEGREFSGRKALHRYLAEREQILRNRRILAKVEIAPAFERSGEEEGLVLVDLTVHARDSLNVMSLPYASYDQNVGLMLGLGGRDYNFLGGMEPLEVALDFIDRDVADAGEKSGTSYRIAGLFNVPFYGLGGNWNLGFEGNLTYNTEGPLQGDAAATLDFDYPLEHLTIRAGAVQEYHRYEESWDDPDVYYLRSVFMAGTSLPTGIDLPLSEELVYEPELFTGVNYKPGDRLSVERRGYEVGYRHALRAGRVDWKGNLRSGTWLELYHSQAYNLARDRWLSELSGEYQFHADWKEIGFSGRAGFFYRAGSVREEAGELLRGILDLRVAGDLGIYSNAALPLPFDPPLIGRWFEGHISPFFDWAVVRPPEDGGLSEKNAWYGTGLELFGFAEFARSLYVRISLGVDAEALWHKGFTQHAPRDGEPPYELFVGMEHHF